jgi:pSer/pThr/pTyr-binding forkhead associated (FHA) protein
MVSDEWAAQTSDRYLLAVTLPDGAEEEHLIEGREVTVGRDPANHIQLSHHFVSQFHAKFVRTGSSLSIVDLGSANKTRVNGREIAQKGLKEGDEIEFASIKCILVLEGNPIPGSPIIPESGQETERPESLPRDPPISKAYLSVGVVLLFAAVVALALQVC